MILPTKGVPPSKALITVGAEVLSILGRSPLSVSGIWLRFNEQQEASESMAVSYDWFILALDLLYLLGVIQITGQGLIRRGLQ